MTDRPDFTAYEINELANRARKNAYYKACHKFVLETLERPATQLSDNQLKWLFGIHKDLKEE